MPNIIITLNDTSIDLTYLPSLMVLFLFSRDWTHSIDELEFEAKKLP